MRKINREYLNNGKVGEKYITKNWIYEIKEATYSCKGCYKNKFGKYCEDYVCCYYDTKDHKNHIFVRYAK